MDLIINAPWWVIALDYAAGVGIGIAVGWIMRPTVSPGETTWHIRILIC